MTNKCVFLNIQRDSQNNICRSCQMLTSQLHIDNMQNCLFKFSPLRERTTIQSNISLIDAYLCVTLTKIRFRWRSQTCIQNLLIKSYVHVNKLM